jgi:hypothetical protein
MVAALTHVERLCTEIGPRGSCTPNEAAAAEYARAELERLGLQPVVEPFSSARSGWWPSSLALGLALAASPLTWAGWLGAVLAVLVLLVAFGSLLLELAFVTNPLRWVLPKGTSQNVWARVPPAGPLRRRVVVVGHLDSHRTPLAFSSKRWLRIFGLMMPIGIIAMAILLAIAFSRVLGAGTAAPWMTVLVDLPLLAMLAITLQADRTPYTVGANDNATAVGAVLELAERLLALPLQNTEVTALLSGCEEVGCYGADAFLRRHVPELNAPLDGRAPEVFWVTVDSVGGQGAELTVIEAHRFLTAARTDPALMRRLEELGERHPELRARPRLMTRGYTESHVAQKYALRHVTFVHLDPAGHLPNWHRPTDVVANLDPDLLARTVTLLEVLLRDVDAPPQEESQAESEKSPKVTGE